MANQNFALRVLFCRLFQRHKGEPYYWGGRDWKATKELLEMDVPADVLAAKLAGYFAEPKWTTFGNHSFPAFVYNLNKIPTAGAKRPAVAVAAPRVRCGCGVILQANSPAWFDHADQCQLTERAAFVSDARADLATVSARGN